MDSLSRPQTLYVTILLLAIGPALIVIHPSIPFLNIGNCDPWYVFGLFYYLPDATHWLWTDGNPARQAARLTNVIPGYLATKAFKGISADYAMFFIYYFASVFLFYQSARILINNKVALFAAIVFAVHPLIVATYSVTFGSPAILYLLVSLYLVARATQAQSSLAQFGLLFSSGLAMAAALHVHLAIIVFGIANYLFYLFYRLFYSSEAVATRIVHLFQGGAAVIIGMIAFTLALGGVAVLLGGNFNLVFQQFVWLKYEFSSNYAKVWFQEDWYYEGGILGMLLAALFLSALNIYVCSFAGKGVIQSESARQRVCALSWAVVLLVLILFVSNELGGNLIQYDYYYVFFVPYFCLVVFSPFLLLRTRGARATLAGATIFLICSLGAVALHDDVLGWLHRSPTEAIASVVLAICAGTAYAGILLSRRTGATVAGCWTIVVLAMLIIVRPDMGRQIWEGPRITQYAREYQTVREGLAFLSTVPFKNYPKFWVDLETAPKATTAIPRSYLSCRYHNQFPTSADDEDLTDAYGRDFKIGDDVVIISAAENLRPMASTAFAALGLAAQEVATFSGESQGARYELLVEHVYGAADARARTSSKWLLDKDPPPDAEEVNVSFGLFPYSKPQKFPVDVTTTAQPWSFAAEYEPRPDNLRGPLWVVVQAEVLAAPLDIGITNPKRTKFFSRTFFEKPGPVTIVLRMVPWELFGYLVVESSGEAKAGKIRIDSVRVLKPPEPTMEKPSTEPPGPK